MAHLKELGENHPAQSTFKPCQEKDKRKVHRFGGTVQGWMRAGLLNIYQSVDRVIIKTQMSDVSHMTSEFC